MGTGSMGFSLINIIFTGSDLTVSYQIQQVLPEENYYRVQGALKYAAGSLDDSTADNIENLKLDGAAIIKANKARLDDLCERLIQLCNKHQKD